MHRGNKVTIEQSNIYIKVLSSKYSYSNTWCLCMINVDNSFTYHPSFFFHQRTRSRMCSG